MDPSTLPVGPALDAQVASAVFQWQDVHYDAEQAAYYGWAPDATVEDYIWPVPGYSTDPRAAQAVLATLRERGLLPAFLRELGRDYPPAAASPPAEAGQVLARLLAEPGAPSIICHAALRVVAAP
jgi:hypothetical protein